MTGESRRMTGEYRRVSRTEIERTAQPTLLDRLTDFEPNVSADRPTNREASIREYRASVQRDVEDLLNTRRTIIEAGTELREVYASVHQYGLPDTTGIAVRTSQGQKTLLEAVRDTLERFEPRLLNPVVRITTESSEPGLPLVRFSVEALLRMSPSPEQVVFDTLLEVASGTYEVRDSVPGAPGGAAPSPSR